LIAYSGCDTFAYDAYGQRVDPLKDVINDGLFYTGEQFDAESSQYYLRARYYNPLTGRFNRIDPIDGSLSDPQSLHKYLYCHANPVNNIDPSGYIVDCPVAPTLQIITTTSIQAQLRSSQSVSYAPIYTKTLTTVASMLLLTTTAIFTELLLYYSVFATLHTILKERTSPVIYQEIVASKKLVEAVARTKAAEQVARQFAHKIGIKQDEIEDLPIFFVFQRITPYIYENDRNAIMRNPLWVALQYVGIGNGNMINANRRAATAGKDYLRTIDRPHLDEYPFASTFQGGAGASVEAVPELEHQTQRVHLSSFYRTKLHNEPKWFLVVPLPL